MRIRFGLSVLAILFLVPLASSVANAEVANSDEAVLSIDAVKNALDNTAIDNADFSNADDSAINLDDGASDSWRRHHRGWGRRFWRGGWGGYYPYYGYGYGYYPYNYWNYYYPWYW